MERTPKILLTKLLKILLIFWICGISPLSQGSLEEERSPYPSSARPSIQGYEPLPAPPKSSTEMARWVQEDLLTPHPPTTLQKVASGTGWVVGTGGCVVCYNLGHSLIVSIYPDEGAGKEGLAIITGGCAAFPIAVLGTLLSRQVLPLAVTSRSEAEKEILEPLPYSKKVGQKGVLGVEAILALVSAAPYAYLTWVYYEPLAKEGAWPLILLALSSKSLADGWALDTMGRWLYGLAHNAYLKRKYADDEASVHFQRFKLLEELEKAERTILSYSPEQAEKFYKDLSTTNEREGNLNKLRNLFDPPPLYTEEPLPPSFWSLTRVTRGVTSVVGTSIGVFASVCLVPLGEVALSSILSSVGLYDPTASQALGWIAGIAAGCLLTHATEDSFRRTHDAIHDVGLALYEGKCPTSSEVAWGAISITAFIESSLASSAHTYISKEYLGDETAFEKLGLSCGAISVCSTFFWAMNNFFKQQFQKLTPHQKLLHIIGLIKQELPLIDPTIIQALYRLIIEGPEENLP